MSNVFQLKIEELNHSQIQSAYRIGAELQDNWSDLSERFRLIRRLYKILTPMIIERDGALDPYFLDWPSVMTPIEFNLWQDIRCNGLGFFPQYPVNKYFADFADPIKKIVIEADGKWHDPVKDETRDNVMEIDGWMVFRFTGAETYDPDVLTEVLELYGLTFDEEESY